MRIEAASFYFFHLHFSHRAQLPFSRGNQPQKAGFDLTIQGQRVSRCVFRRSVSASFSFVQEM